MNESHRHTIVVQIKARHGMGARYESMMKDLISLMSAESCFINFQVMRAASDADRFLFLENWTDRDSYMEIRQRDYFKQYVKDREEFIEPDFERSEWVSVIEACRGDRA